MKLFAQFSSSYRDEEENQKSLKCSMSNSQKNSQGLFLFIFALSMQMYSLSVPLFFLQTSIGKSEDSLTNELILFFIIRRAK